MLAGFTITDASSGQKLKKLVVVRVIRVIMMCFRAPHRPDLLGSSVPRSGRNSLLLTATNTTTQAWGLQPGAGLGPTALQPGAGLGPTALGRPGAYSPGQAWGLQPGAGLGPTAYSPGQAGPAGLGPTGLQARADVGPTGLQARGRRGAYRPTGLQAGADVGPTGLQAYRPGQHAEASIPNHQLQNIRAFPACEERLL